MKFIHAADLHLDSPLRGLARYPGAPIEEARSATRRALEHLVRLATDEPVDLVLIAGDVYDGDWRDYHTGLFFASQMSRLREAGIPVFAVSGNHDARSVITRTLRLPDNVRHFSADGPETAIVERLGVAVHGHGYAERWVQTDLSASYPAPVPGLLNIGLLHTSASARGPHETYAPCSVDALAARGYDYWALGHVHDRQVLHRDPWAVFSGCLQGRSVLETGPKGCTLVEAGDREITSVRHVELDVVRWAWLRVDASRADAPEQAVDAVREELAAALRAADGRLLAARVELTGASPAHEALWADPARWESEVRAVATDLAPDGLWIERVLLRTTSAADLDAARAQGGPLAALLDSLGRYRDDPDLLLADIGAGREAADVRELAGRLVRDGELAAELSLADPARVAGLLDEVEGLLLTRLTGGSAA